MPNKSRPPPTRNRLLAALPGEEYARLLPHLEAVDRGRLEAAACECYGVVKAYSLRPGL